MFEKGDYTKIAFPKGGGRCGDPEPRAKDKLGGSMDVWIQRDFCSVATGNTSEHLLSRLSWEMRETSSSVLGERWQAWSLEGTDKIPGNIVKNLGRVKGRGLGCIKSLVHGSRTCIE